MVMKLTITFKRKIKTTTRIIAETKSILLIMKSTIMTTVITMMNRFGYDAPPLVLRRGIGKTQ